MQYGTYNKLLEELQMLPSIRTAKKGTGGGI